MAKDQPCKYKGSDYTHNSRMCEDEKCMKCNNGKWEIIGQSCPC